MPGALIICRHNPTITMGRQSREENIFADKRALGDLKIKVYEIERGGDVTYHGPGQLCIYPIVNLGRYKKGIRWFLRTLEAMIRQALIEFGIEAQARAGLTGVWVEQKKIASIGIAVRNWITLHGASLNVKCFDLDNFRLIRPCGMDIIMTSMESALGRKINMSQVKRVIIKKFNRHFCQEEL